MKKILLLEKQFFKSTRLLATAITTEYGYPLTENEIILCTNLFVLKSNGPGKNKA